MRFDSPAAFLLLILTPLVLDRPWRRAVLAHLGLHQGYASDEAVLFSSRVDLTHVPRSTRLRMRVPLISILRVLALICLIIALARPQAGFHFVETEASGRDIMLVLDVSGSMRALDFRVENKRVERLDALKAVVKTFIDSRPNDRMGLVIFGTDVFTQCPLTLDHAVLKEFVEGLEVGMAGDATALGDGVAIALKRLKDIEADSRVLVLVTDGLRTAGQMNPREAAKIAKDLQVKIYTVGIGGKEPAPFAQRGIFGMRTFDYHDVPLDQETLIDIAEITGGRYFNAKKTEQLKQIYDEINSLEERSEKTFEFVEYEELFLPFVGTGFVLFLIGELLTMTIFRTIP